MVLLKVSYRVRADHIQEFEKRWKPFLNDSRVQEIFRFTGSMAENENFALLEPALEGEWS